MNRSENLVRFRCRALADVIVLHAARRKNIYFNKIKNARNERDLLRFKPEIIKYERLSLRIFFG